MRAACISCRLMQHMSCSKRGAYKSNGIFFAIQLMHVYVVFSEMGEDVREQMGVL